MTSSAPAPAPAAAAPPLTSASLLEPAETTVRKKTRKALLPGHAARENPAPPPPPPATPQGAAPAVQLPAVAPDPPPPQPSYASQPSYPSPQPSPPQPPPQPAADPTPATSSSFSAEPPAPASSGFSFLRKESSASAAPPPPPPEPEVPEKPAPPAPAASRPPPPEPAAEPQPPAPAAPPSKQPKPPAQPAAAAAPPPPPPPPAEPEPVDLQAQLEAATDVTSVRDWLRKAMGANLDQQRNILEEQQQCLAGSWKATDEIAGMRQKLVDTEAEQNRLCEVEQFEEAGALDATIQELKEAITAHLDKIAHASKKMEELAGDLRVVAEDRKQVAGQVLEKAQVIQSDSEHSLGVEEERNERKLSSESARLEAERKRVELAQSHLSKDRERLEEEDSQLREAMGQHTGEYEKERDDALTDQLAVEGEIAELKRQLAAKEAERAKLVEVVAAANEKINSVRSKFERQITRLEGNRRRFEETKKEVEMDTEHVEGLEAALARDRQAAKEEADLRKQEIQDIAQELRSLRRTQRAAEWTAQMRSLWQRMQEPGQKLLGESRSRWEQATAECNRIAGSLEEDEAEAAKLRGQIDTIQQQIPSLEAEKKLAVSSRSFKEAGRISEEIKKREEDKRHYEAGLQLLQDGLRGAREQLTEFRQAEEQAQEELLEVEAKCGQEEIRILQRQMRDLETLSSKISSTSDEFQLLLEELQFLRGWQENLAAKHSVSLEDLSEMEFEELPQLQDSDAEAEKEAETAPADESAGEHFYIGDGEAAAAEEPAAEAGEAAAPTKEEEVSEEAAPEKEADDGAADEEAAVPAEADGVAAAKEQEEAEALEGEVAQSAEANEQAGEEVAAQENGDDARVSAEQEEETAPAAEEAETEAAKVPAEEEKQSEVEGSEEAPPPS